MGWLSWRGVWDALPSSVSTGGEAAVETTRGRGSPGIGDFSKRDAAPARPGRRQIDATSVGRGWSGGTRCRAACSSSERCSDLLEQRLLYATPLEHVGATSILRNAVSVVLSSDTKKNTGLVRWSGDASRKHGSSVLERRWRKSNAARMRPERCCFTWALLERAEAAFCLVFYRSGKLERRC